jgi:hypothetical protein
VLPQVPQLLGLVSRLVSQPLPALLSQLAKPAVQVKPQVPLVQVAVAFATLVVQGQWAAL